MEAFFYEVRVEGLLTQPWPQWFAGIRVEHDGNAAAQACTKLHVPGSDVSLLHGVLAQIGSLNPCLVSVTRKKAPQQACEPGGIRERNRDNPSGGHRQQSESRRHAAERACG